MAEVSIARLVATRMAERGWNQSDLVREAGINKNTVSDLLGGRTTPSVATLGKIEQALGLTPGSLVDSGEDAQSHRAAGGDIESVSARRLAAELTRRVIDLEEWVADNSDDVRRRGAHVSEVVDFATGLEAEAGPEGDLARRWLELDSLSTGRTLSRSEEEEWAEVTLGLDAARWNSRQIERQLREDAGTTIRPADEPHLTVREPDDLATRRGKRTPDPRYKPGEHRPRAARKRSPKGKPESQE